MKIKTRLIIMSSTFFAGLILISGMLFYQLRVNEHYSGLIESMKDLKSHVYETNLQLDRMMFGSELVEEHAAFQDTYRNMRSEMDSFFQKEIYLRLLNENQSIESDTTTLQNTFLMNDDKTAELNENVQELGEQYKTYLPGLFEASVYYDDDLVQTTLDSVEILSENFSGRVSVQLDTIVDTIEAAVAVYERRSRMIVLLAVGAAVLFVALMSFSTITQLRRRISRLEGGIRRLETGDLSQLLSEDGRDEISRISKSINTFLSLFCRMIGEIKELSGKTKQQKEEVDETTEASVQAVQEIRQRANGLNEKYKRMIEHLRDTENASAVIKESLEVFAENMTNQSSAVNQSTASIEEMNASIENVVEIARKRKEASAQMVEVTEHGGEKVEYNNGLIEQNAEDAKEVENIITLINGIASQTNLLAMNAAIEAAHAGEAGRGFAVVAEEIRTFAESTNSNSKRIRTAIQNITQRIDEIYSGSSELLTAFEQIISETRGSDDALSEISGSIQEISIGSSEIMNAMNSLNTATSQIQERTGEIRTSIANTTSAIRNVYSIGNGVNTEIDELESEIHEIEQLISKVNNLNSENSRVIHELNGEMEKFILPAEGALKEVDS